MPKKEPAISLTAYVTVDYSLEDGSEGNITVSRRDGVGMTNARGAYEALSSRDADLTWTFFLGIRLRF